MSTALPRGMSQTTKTRRMVRAFKADLEQAVECLQDADAFYAQGDVDKGAAYVMGAFFLIASVMPARRYFSETAKL